MAKIKWNLKTLQQELNNLAVPLGGQAGSSKSERPWQTSSQRTPCTLGNIARGSPCLAWQAAGDCQIEGQDDGCSSRKLAKPTASLDCKLQELHPTELHYSAFLFDTMHTCNDICATDTKIFPSHRYFLVRVLGRHTGSSSAGPLAKTEGRLPEQADNLVCF